MKVRKAVTALLQHVGSWDDALFTKHSETAIVIITTSLNFDIFVNGLDISGLTVPNSSAAHMLDHFHALHINPEDAFKRISMVDDLTGHL